MTDLEDVCEKIRSFYKGVNSYTFLLWNIDPVDKIDKIRLLIISRNTMSGKYPIEIYFLSVMLQLYLFRAAVPEFKYPFLIFFWLFTFMFL